MTKDQCKLDMRHALWAAREIRKYQPYGRTIQHGITPLHHKAARMYPEHPSPEQVRAQYFGLLRRAANRRQELLTHPGGEWRVAGRTDDGRVVYLAPLGTKAPR